MGTSAQPNEQTAPGLESDSLRITVPGKIILQSVLGSRAYGMATPDSDYDRQGVFVASRKALTGLRTLNPTASQTGPDYTFHEVGKFMTLALKCNPTILEQLFIEQPEISLVEGGMLRANRDMFLSTSRVLGAFGGYAMDQINRLQKRGDGSFSSDTRNRREKHSRHCFRLLWQGTELLKTGQITVRVPERKVAMLFEIGRMNDSDMNDAFQQEDAIFKKTAETSILPDAPDFKRADRLLHAIRDIADL